jgi:glyceraldehyde-3-phosphate dehydrogenase (NAD(P))
MYQNMGSRYLEQGTNKNDSLLIYLPEQLSPVMIRVGINGYGTIGRRVADAVSRQKDMEVSGVIKTKPDYVAMTASSKFKIFVPDRESIKKFQDKSLDVQGDLDDLVSASDIIIDCTPEGQGEKNIQIYRKHKKKAIFQGGESSSLAEVSFNAYANYDSASGKEYVRVVSCNTTGLARTLSTLRDHFGVSEASATLIRRATDPNDSKKGPINALEPDLHFPSHHGPDVMTVMDGISIETSAVKAPTTLMHLHSVTVKIKSETDLEHVLRAFESRRRLMIVSGKNGITSTAQVMDLARELGRERSDLYEIAIWRENVNLNGRKINYMQAVHQESDVVPENVDAVRAVFGLQEKEKSIELTDMALGIKEKVY